MKHHLICCKLVLHPFEAVKDIEMLFQRLSQPEVRNAVVLLGRQAQPLMGEQCAANEAVAGTLGDQTVKGAIDVKKRHRTPGAVRTLEKFLHLLAQECGFLPVQFKTGLEDRLRFERETEGQAFDERVRRIEKWLKCPGSTGKLRNDSVSAQYF